MSSSKPKIAFFDFASCEGCQLTVVDILQTDLELLDVVEIVQFREAMSEMGDDYQIAFVEGSCTRPQDEARLKAIREQASLVIALGACAHLGGVNAIRNVQDIDRVKHIVYGKAGEKDPSYEARPISAVISIDGVIPGCPIDRKEFIHATKLLLMGRKPQLPDQPVCYECKLKENACLVDQGKPCLGSITVAGCGAICPSFGDLCLGCRGLLPEANIASLMKEFHQRGIDIHEKDFLGMYLTYELAQRKVEFNGR